MQRKAKPVDAIVVLEVERDESGGTSGSLDRVIELFEPACGASRPPQWAPAFAKASAVAQPMPREAPVTSAMRPASGGGIYKSTGLGEERELPRQ